MKFLQIDDVREGMILGKDILTPAGESLLSRGTTLSDATINSLRSRGITRLGIETEVDSQEFSKEEIDRAKAICEDKIICRFGLVPSDGMMKILFDMALEIEAMEYLNREQRNG